LTHDVGAPSFVRMRDDGSTEMEVARRSLTKTPGVGRMAFAVVFWVIVAGLFYEFWYWATYSRLWMP